MPFASTSALIAANKRIFAPLLVIGALAANHAWGAAPDWVSAKHFRVLLSIDAKRPNSPAAVQIDFQKWLGHRGAFDETTLEVISVGTRDRMPHRVNRFLGTSEVTLNFVTTTSAQYAVYFDTVAARRGKPRLYHGLVGDGDRFCHEFGRREIAPTHFDCFADLDRDGDLDLFKGGVEPFVYCYENIGDNRLVARGKLTSGGAVLKLPCSKDHRSWVTVAFYDIDGDGDVDFVPSFGDGPDNGKFVFYENVSADLLTFRRTGVLHTASGTALAGGRQAGGWFPSIAFVSDWDSDGNGPDALVGSNHGCWLYRKLGLDDHGKPVFADAIAIQAGGANIHIINPRFAVADIDADGDLDLFAGSQPGPVHWFENFGSLTNPVFAPGRIVAWSGRYLIGDAHSGVALADFDGDGLLDLASGRFWERTDLDRPDAPRDFGACFENAGDARNPKFAHNRRRGPFTEQFQICDAVRQNSLRATDWDGDGKLDLLAGDTDGFIWLFRNRGEGGFALFAPAERLLAAAKPLSVAATGGHARFDVCDWNNDGVKDLVVADGSGTVSLFLGGSKRALRSGEKLSAGGKPLRFGGRASVLVCDWNNDGAKDLVLADDKGYYFCQNASSDAAPVLADPTPILFGGKKVTYVRPNLGSFVDWNGDGKKDLIGCHFENTIRFYPNIGSGAANEEPRFSDPEGVVILRGESPQMISGADVLDWNGDRRPDILTGQGHGGSGLRYYERSWLENELEDTHPKVVIQGWQQRDRALKR